MRKRKRDIFKALSESIMHYGANTDNKTEKKEQKFLMIEMIYYRNAAKLSYLRKRENTEIRKNIQRVNYTIYR